MNRLLWTVIAVLLLANCIATLKAEIYEPIINKVRDMENSILTLESTVIRLEKLLETKE